MEVISINDTDCDNPEEEYRPCLPSTLHREHDFIQEKQESLCDEDREEKMINKPDRVRLYCDGEGRCAKTFDVSDYMADREMSPSQEKINALTVLPNPLYCLFYILNGKFISDEMVSITDMDPDYLDTSRCITSALFPNLHSLPPLPMIAIALGIILHAPFSFIYHWHYAPFLPPQARMEHWSRRLDHAFIHVISMFMTYGVTGNWNYFLANVMFNISCAWTLMFQKKIYPRRNKIRILISILGYCLPILVRGDGALFCQLFFLFGLSGWLFAKYPIGGWSHSAFHFVIAFIPPLLMDAARGLSASEEGINEAIMCAIWKGGV